MFFWDGGLKLSKARLAIDFQRRQPRAFISHAHTDHMARHEYALCTPETAALYQARFGPRPTLPMPCRTPIEWGGLRLATYPAGHCLGSAMLLAEDGDQSLLYTGDFKLEASATCELAELPRANMLVIESTFGDPHYRLPPRAEVVEQLLTLVSRTVRDRGIPVIEAYSLGKSQEVTRLLTAEGFPVLQHRSAYAISQVYESLRSRVGAIRVAARPARAGQRGGRPAAHAAAGRRGRGADCGDRLGGRSAGQVSPGRRSCPAAVRPCRLRRSVGGGAAGSSGEDLLHPRAGNLRRSAAGRGFQRVSAGAVQRSAAAAVLTLDEPKANPSFRWGRIMACRGPGFLWIGARINYLGRSGESGRMVAGSLLTLRSGGSRFPKGDFSMRRREFLLSTGLAALSVSAFPTGWVSAAGNKKQRVLYFTRSAGFEHSVVRRKGDELAHSEKILTELGQRSGFEVVCTKDGSVFDGDLDQWDGIAFYTSGDLTKPDKQNDRPMSPQGKQRLLDAIAAGKGFIAFHSSSDSFHTAPGPRTSSSTRPSPIPSSPCSAANSSSTATSGTPP